MSRTLSLAGVVVGLASAAEAAGRFEGRIDVRVTSQPRDSGVVVAYERLYISPLGWRSETLGAPDGRARRALLRLNSTPGVLYFVDELRRTYSVGHEEDNAGTSSQEDFRLERVDRARIGKYRCSHVVLRGERGSVIEQWLTKDVRGLERWATEVPRTRRSSVAIRILEQARADGLPVRMVIRIANGLVKTWDVVSVERSAVAARLFDVTRYVEDDSKERD